jgi:hypothetical protein
MIVLAVDGHDHVGSSLVPVVSALNVGASLLEKNVSGELEVGREIAKLYISHE